MENSSWFEPWLGIAFPYIKNAFKIVTTQETNILEFPEYNLNKYEVMYEYYHCLDKLGFKDDALEGLRRLYMCLDARNETELHIIQTISETYPDLR